jgi:putative flippase GtrA
MQGVQAFLSHHVVGSTARYAIAGVIVALVYLALPLILNGMLGAPIEAVIPLAYLAALTLHFNLQRHFVFRHVDVFALEHRQQVARYAALAAVQYPLTAILTAVLPGALDMSQRAAYVATVVTISLASFFLVLRRRVFHPADS